MQSEEYEPFEKKYGYHPASFPAAVDALAIYVNKDNPIQCLTMGQLDRIFSKSYGPGDNISNWGDLGLTGEWASHPIALFGRNSLSGAHDVFVAAVLNHLEFKDNLKEQPGSAEVIKAVAANKYAIGYSGIGYLTDQVRAVPLAVASGYECVDLFREVSPRALFVRLSQQGAEQAARSGDARIRQIRSLQGWAERDGQKRVLSDHARDQGEGAEGSRHFRR
jgi:hypothetical protein